MNIAMLGSGFIGRFYADSLHGYRSKDKIVTIYSRREESSKKFARDYNVPFSTTNMEEAINRPEVEVVCISLPNNLHEEAVMLCCKHKKAVITTKPLGRNAAEAKRMLEAVEKAGIDCNDLVFTPVAVVLFKDKPYLIFFIAAILVCIPLSFYYGFANLFLNQAGMEDAAGKMTLGQVSEALFILAIPFLFYRIGVKNMVLIGMLAWFLRYVCFAHGDNDANLWMLYAGIILHGICYDFFFVTGYMYTERKAGAKIKNAAQGLFTFATYGLGMFIGTWFSGFTADHFTENDQYDWTSIWYVPAGIAVFVLVYFLLFFHEKKEIKPAS